MWRLINIYIKVSIRFLVHENVGFASEIKFVYQLLTKILTIFDVFCGHF